MKRIEEEDMIDIFLLTGANISIWKYLSQNQNEKKREERERRRDKMRKRSSDG